MDTLAAAATDQAAAIDPTLLAVLSIFGGVAFTAGAGLMGAWIQSRREHRKWIRERRYETFTRIFTLLQNWRRLAVDMKKAFEKVEKLQGSQDPTDQADLIRATATLEGFSEQATATFADVTECDSKLQILGPKSVQHAVNTMVMGVVGDVSDDAWSDYVMTFAKVTRKAMSIR